MTDLLSRACNYVGDIERVITLLLNYRTAVSLHAYPHPWRLRLLLSSRVWQPAQDSRIWEEGNGRMAAFAMLWRRHRDSPYLALERFVDPAQVSDNLVDAMLQWGVERAQTVAAGLEKPSALYTRRLATAVHPDRQLEAYDFTPVPPDPGNHGVTFTRPLQDVAPEPALPIGYVIRPLRNAAELAAYDELYGFLAVSPQHRQETFRSGEYGYLVIVDAAGQFVAYVVGLSSLKELYRRGVGAAANQSDRDSRAKYTTILQKYAALCSIQGLEPSG